MMEEKINKELTPQEIIEFLKSPLPDGSVQSRNKDKKFIPIQVYIDRLNDESIGHLVKVKITHHHIDWTNDVIEVRVSIQIGEAEREGIGITSISRYENTNKPVNVNNDAGTAYSHAIRDACDKFQMGWVDLADHREWGANPGLWFNRDQNSKKTSSGSTKTSEKCIKCQKPLTEEDLQLLRDYDISLKFCSKDIPQHMLKRKG
ncbi:hypothetical protein [Niallia taxi]|uniref:hypothetical protein n=1 Tax=Niallia taxi TaxID=2499688 RepID=UPI0015F6FCD4|nr:hypothetical protein [Niallia taxi]